METGLKNIKDVLDEAIMAENKCYDGLSRLLSKENQRFKSVILERIVLILAKLSTGAPSDILKEIEALEAEYGAPNMG